jgi:hypothetical protein
VRYLVLAALCLAATIAYIPRNCIGVSEGSIRASLGLSEYEMSWVMSSFFITYAVLQIPTAWLGHVWGARRALTVFAVSWSVASGLVGLALGMPLLLLTRLGMGAAQAGLFPIAYTKGTDFQPADAPGRFAVDVRLIGGDNRFYAMAGRPSDIDARSRDLTIHYAGPDRLGRLHVLALGVNKYVRDSLLFAAEQLDVPLRERQPKITRVVLGQESKRMAAGAKRGQKSDRARDDATRHDLVDRLMIHRGGVHVPLCEDAAIDPGHRGSLTKPPA